ncbi:MAG: M23 family metallopeptidase [Anaerolineae bacterium]|nr:M23 family metallopeptidase [Anaerolineae bacterium]
MAPNTPGSRVPSHGTDQLGERYAFDFLQVDWNRTGRPFYRGSLLSYIVSGVALNDCYCWGQAIYAPFDAVVVAAKDGVKERQRVNIVADVSYAFRMARSFSVERDDIQAVAGNYVILQNRDGIYGGLVHLQEGSVAVSVGQKVERGAFSGRVGHSGNSTAPHLHFQLMDNSDLRTARGIPCGFEEYEVFKDNIWKRVRNGIPTNRQRISFEG